MLKEVGNLWQHSTML